MGSRKMLSPGRQSGSLSNLISRKPDGAFSGGGPCVLLCLRSRENCGIEKIQLEYKYGV